MDSYPFSSPGTAHSASFGFGTSPAVPLDQSLPVQNRSTYANTNANSNTNTNTNTAEGGGGIEDMDIDALLAQLTNGNGNGNGNHSGDHDGNGGDGMDLMNLPMGINLEELFGHVDHAAEHNEELAEDMMKFLAGLEEHTEVNGDGGGGNEQGNVDGGGGGNGQDDGDSKRN
jgi:hypothetical protein